ncbi:uncharacterized protein [Dermacentor albipictus]|uniref:uncharacterized protein n=1 Tax=Dermacentor albipictus TaxID=60249 RepID=UPI0038FCBCBF
MGCSTAAAFLDSATVVLPDQLGQPWNSQELEDALMSELPKGLQTVINSERDDGKGKAQDLQVGHHDAGLLGKSVLSVCRNGHREANEMVGSYGGLSTAFVLDCRKAFVRRLDGQPDARGRDEAYVRFPGSSRVPFRL